MPADNGFATSSSAGTRILRFSACSFLVCEEVEMSYGIGDRLRVAGMGRGYVTSLQVLVRHLRGISRILKLIFKLYSLAKFN